MSEQIRTWMRLTENVGRSFALCLASFPEDIENEKNTGITSEYMLKLGRAFSAVSEFLAVAETLHLPQPIQVELNPPEGQPFKPF